MRVRLPRRHWAFVLAVLLLPILRVPAQDAPVPAARDRHVVVITIDGLAASAFDEPRPPMPTVLRLAREGARARRVTTVNPAMTWPAHATIVTGVTPARHGLLVNGLLVREGPGKPLQFQQRPREDLVRVPAVYDLAHAAGLTTALVDWIPDQDGGSVAWSFPERPDPKGATEQALVADGVFAPEDMTEFFKSTIVWRDEAWTRAAVHLLKKHKPNLMLLHLLALDSSGHRHGPRSIVAAPAAAALADMRVRDVLDAVREAGIADRTTVIVMSDHGFRPMKTVIRPNAILLRGGMLTADAEKKAATACEAYAITEGGTAFLYATDPAKREATLARLREIFRSVEGIARILGPEDYAAAGYPAPGPQSQMGDLVLVAKEGYGFWHDVGWDPVGEAREGVTPVGHHGFPAEDPEMDAFLVAWGRGIRPGAALDRIRLVDVAPTVAALLGLRMEGVDGRVLSELLSEPR
jgi:predicted AlkP superfamily pyrophosphatase or phosphodiesterase